MSQSQFIRFMAGCCRLYVIARIAQLESGVACYDSKGDMVGFLPTTDEALKARAENLLYDCIDPTKKFKQPDWSFLEVKTKPVK